MAERRQVRLMSDYGAQWPLWGAEGELDGTEYDLPDDLRARMRAWQDYFETHFHYDTGWRADHHAQVYADEGRELRRLLSAEIGWLAQVELDLWPVPPADHGPERHRRDRWRQRATVHHPSRGDR